MGGQSLDTSNISGSQKIRMLDTSQVGPDENRPFILSQARFLCPRCDEMDLPIPFMGSGLLEGFLVQSTVVDRNLPPNEMGVSKNSGTMWYPKMDGL